MVTRKKSQQPTPPMTEESLPVFNLEAALEQMSLEEIQTTIDQLSRDLQRGQRFISLQEEELSYLGEAIANLEAKLQGAREEERLSLEADLVEERERKNLLEASLYSQSRANAKRETALKQHSLILQLRQVESKSLEELLEEVKENIGENSPPPNRWRWSILLFVPLIGLLVTGVTAFYAWQFTRQSPSQEPVSARQTPKNNAVAALGYLEPKGEVIRLSARIGTEGARVEKLLVKQGDWVKAGQVVAILDSRDNLQVALEQAKTQVKIAQSRLKQVQAGAKKGDIQAQDARFERSQAELSGQISTQQSTIASLKAQFQGEKTVQGATVERLKAELKNAQTDCRRYHLLYQDGVVSQRDHEGICLKAETAQKSLQEAQANLKRIVSTWQDKIREANANLERTVTTLQRQVNTEQAVLHSVEEVRPIDVQVLRGEVQGSEMAVKKAQADLDLAYVRSPRDGQILKIHTWAGEIVGESGIVSLGQTDQMYVKAEVYETDISQVRSGQLARIKSDGIVSELTGIVEQIGLQIDKQKILGLNPSADTDARVVEVKIRLNSKDSKRVAGLTNLQVKVIIDTSVPEKSRQSSQ